MVNLTQANGTLTSGNDKSNTFFGKYSSYTMDLAMPSIRFSNSARFYIQAFRHLSWQIEVYLLGLKRIDEESDKKPTVSELYKKTIEYMKNILQEADIRWVKSKDVYDTSSILPENTKLNTWDEEEDDIA